MRPKSIILLLAVLALLAAPVSAQVLGPQTKNYNFEALNTITTPTSGTTPIPAPYWVGPDTNVAIDFSGSPTLVQFNIEANINNLFACLATSGVPGCEALIITDTLTNMISTTGTTGSVFLIPVGTGTDSSLGGQRYEIGTGAQGAANTGGAGQYCFADINETLRASDMGSAYVPATPTEVTALQTAYCPLLGLSQGLYVPGIPPVNPQNMGEMDFDLSHDNYEMFTAGPHMYFELQPGVIFGEYSAGVGARTAEVPGLSLYGAVLGGGLISGLAIWNRRRKKN